MLIRDYLKDRIPGILLHLAGIIAVSLFLAAGAVSRSMIILLIMGWLTVIFFYYLVGYSYRSRYFKKLEETLSSLDKPYLLGEIMEKPYSEEDNLYRELLRRSNKSVIEAIYKLEQEQKDYREYIENWVHNIKVPITAIELICENQTEAHGKVLSGKIRPELAKIENCAESALFYARADAVYQDFFMKELDLAAVAATVTMKNKSLLIQNNMAVDITITGGSIYCDEKWLEFILSQILLNSTKYRKGDSGKISFTGHNEKSGFWLTVEDNGIGIKAGEVDRVFDKGFTGTNGRQRQKATGMGLYLCRKLCRCLSLGISAESVEGEYTRIKLFFPLSDYNRL